MQGSGHGETKDHKEIFVKWAIRKDKYAQFIEYVSSYGSFRFYASRLKQIYDLDEYGSKVIQYVPDIV